MPFFAQINSGSDPGLFCGVLRYVFFSYVLMLKIIGAKIIDPFVFKVRIS